MNGTVKFNVEKQRKIHAVYEYTESDIRFREQINTCKKNTILK
jgi:hypothetical protein